jgi:hypothetical protein
MALASARPPDTPAGHIADAKPRPGHVESTAGDTVRPLAAFAVPNFRRFTTGQAISLVGSWTETVAQAVPVLQLTHSGVWLGLPCGGFTGSCDKGRRTLAPCRRSWRPSA